MDRRRFLLTSVVGALAMPLAADAQPTAKVPRIDAEGALVDVAYVEELRPSPDHTDVRISWTVHPGQCVIRWDYIITVQRMADAPAPIDPRPAPGLYL
jgi:hypothetical protein